MDQIEHKQGQTREYVESIGDTEKKERKKEREIGKEVERTSDYVYFSRKLSDFVVTFLGIL